ncbi:unnamed protein product [Rhizoctonia solani]|uniref:Uncharacterized protein n=1 Tax=Rhizoctonia solani TaxID=456999 RepID=A0A8H2XYQ6_9AGAM|nr:unnamed protein product [Rhizoctonia solani]
MMPANLPTEILDLIVQYSAIGTRTQLAAISRNVHFISVRILYAFIPEMSLTPTIRCLLTLSTKPDLAFLVRSFSIHLSISPYFLQAFLSLLSRALENMKYLRMLSLDVQAPITIDLLKWISCQLTKLSLVIPPRTSYPVSQFLSSQPAIEELLLVCRAEDVSGLSPEALPLLRNLSAPLWVLPIIITSRLPRLSRLSVLGVMTEPDELIVLGMILVLSNFTESLALIISVRITANMMPIEAVSRGLCSIGLAAPFVSLLVLKKSGDCVRQDELENMFISALPSFPKLKGLVLTSRPPVAGAYICGPQTQPAQISSGVVSLVFKALAYFYRMLLKIPGIFFLLFSSRPSIPRAEPDQTQNQPNLDLDALRDTSCQPRMVKAWSQIHSELEYVVFPGKMYRIRKSSQRKLDDCKFDFPRV